MRLRKTVRTAFTMLELMIVIAIISILVALFVGGFRAFVMSYW